MSSAENITNFFPEVKGNLSRVTWAHAVNNKAYLTSTLNNSNIRMIEADVVLGTLTASPSETIPIMAHPPANSSDLSLQSFLKTVTDFNNNAIAGSADNTTGSSSNGTTNIPVPSNSTTNDNGTSNSNSTSDSNAAGTNSTGTNNTVASGINSTNSNGSTNSSSTSGTNTADTNTTGTNDTIASDIISTNPNGSTNSSGTSGTNTADTNSTGTNDTIASDIISINPNDTNLSNISDTSNGTNGAMINSTGTNDTDTAAVDNSNFNSTTTDDINNTNSANSSLPQNTARLANTTANISRKGVKLDFKTIEAFSRSVGIISNYNNESFPLWLNADILPGPVNSTVVPVNATQFLSLAKQFGKATLSLGWTTAVTTGTGSYTDKQIDEMIDTIKKHNVTNEITFAVRSALAAESLPQMRKLLQGIKDSTLTLWSAETDKVNVDKLRTLIASIGLDKTFIDVPDNLMKQLNLANLPSSATLVSKMSGILSLLTILIVVFA